MGVAEMHICPSCTIEQVNVGANLMVCPNCERVSIAPSPAGRGEIHR